MKLYKLLLRKPLIVFGLMLVVFSLTACGGAEASKDGDEASVQVETEAPKEEAEAVETVDKELLGSYECTGSDMQGTKLDPAGEWLKLEENGRGKWFLGATEDSFAWTSDGNEIDFAVDVDGSDIKMQYTAVVEDGQIVLNTGMLYYFTKLDGENPQAAKEVDLPAEEASVATGYPGWGFKPQGEITIPCYWYGVAQFRDCEGFDFEEMDYDVWGVTDETSSGDAYFELWFDLNDRADPLLSVYIDRYQTEWLTPIIGEDDGFVDLESGGGDYQVLEKDHEGSLQSQYQDGALDIYHAYYDDEGRIASCRFFIRETGTGWHEDSDPLPPGYEDYKAEHGHIKAD